MSAATPAPEVQGRQLWVTPHERLQAGGKLRQAQAPVQDHVQRRDGGGSGPRATYHRHAPPMPRTRQLCGNALRSWLRRGYISSEFQPQAP